MEWVSVAIQAGGAIGVCSMFIWYLGQKQKADDLSRKEFLDHLEKKDQIATDNLKEHMGYLRDRDQQSRELATNGYKALEEVASEIRALRDGINCHGNRD